ncbi:MAG: hypothetical protein AAFV90_17520 [Cyanobacteria bacterium J06634_5]
MTIQSLLKSASDLVSATGLQARKRKGNSHGPRPRWRRRISSLIMPPAHAADMEPSNNADDPVVLTAMNRGSHGPRPISRPRSRGSRSIS